MSADDQPVPAAAEPDLPAALAALEPQLRAVAAQAVRDPADPLMPLVSVVLGGKRRTLRFDFNAMHAVEQECGINLLMVDWRNLSIGQTRALVWACLLHEEPALTLSTVGGWLHMGNIGGVGHALGLLWQRALAPQEGGEADAPVPLAPRRRGASTGRRSGRSRSSTSASPTPASGA